MRIGGCGRWTGFGIGERSGEVVTGAVEVERLGLGPQPPDDRARLGEARRRRGRRRGRAGRAPRTPGGPAGWLGREPTPMPKSSRPPRHDVDGRGDLGQHGGWSEAVAGHEQPEAHPSGLCGEGREQRPALEDRPARVAADRHEVIEQPRVLDLRDRVRLAPHAQDVVVVDLHGGCHDPETLVTGFVLYRSSPSGTVLRSRYGALFRLANRRGAVSDIDGASGRSRANAPTPAATSRPCWRRPPPSSSRPAWTRRCVTSRQRPASGWARSTATSRARADLVIAVYRHQVEACAEAGPALLASSRTPYAALTRWIDLFVDFLVTKHGLAAVLQSDNVRLRRPCTLTSSTASCRCALNCSRPPPQRARSAPTWTPMATSRHRQPLRRRRGGLALRRSSQGRDLHRRAGPIAFARR